MIARLPVIKGHSIWLTTGDEARRKAAVEFPQRPRERRSEADHRSCF
jgi:hypothetical protein